MWENKSVLITGGTGYLGRALIDYLSVKHCKRIIAYARDPHKHEELKRDFFHVTALRSFMGDILDKERLNMAMKGVDICIHTAALKSIASAEYNPSEAYSINVAGTHNILAACHKNKVRMTFLSTDKAVNPTTHYGKTKALAESLTLNYNYYSTLFSAVRYGNVMGSTGSVLPLFQDLAKKKSPLPITDPEMTRFWMSKKQAVRMVELSLTYPPGSLVVGHSPTFKVVDLAATVHQRLPRPVIGVKPNEKIHEILISKEELPRAQRYKDHYLIEPAVSYDDSIVYHIKGTPVTEEYTSDNRKDRLTRSEIRDYINPPNQAFRDDRSRYQNGKQSVAQQSSNPREVSPRV